MGLVRNQPSAAATGLVSPASGLTAAGTTAGVSRPTQKLGSISLPGTDFVSLDVVKRQCIALLYGDAGLGKTTAAVSLGPEPMALINLDGRARWAVKKAQDAGRRVHYLEVQLPIGISRMTDDKASLAAKTAIDTVMRNVDAALNASVKGDIRLIAIDTGTELGEFLTIRYRGNQKGAPKDYGKSKDLINSAWWSIFNDVRSSSAHLVVLSRAKAIWENNEPTGEFEPRINDVVRDAADWAAHIRRRKSIRKGGLIVKGQLLNENEWRITKAGNNGGELGAVYTADDWGELGPFVYACTQMYPDTQPEDWQ